MFRWGPAGLPSGKSQGQCPVFQDFKDQNMKHCLVSPLPLVSTSSLWKQLCRMIANKKQREIVVKYILAGKDTLFVFLFFEPLFWFSCSQKMSPLRTWYLHQNPNQYYSSLNEFIIIYQCIRNQECQKIAAKKGKDIQFLSSSRAAPQQATQKTIQATVEDETAEVRADAGTPGLAHFTLSKIKDFSNKMIRYTIMSYYLKKIIPIYCSCKVISKLPGISLPVAVTWPQIASVSINRLGCWRIRECCVWSSHRSCRRCLSAKFKGKLQVFYRVVVQLVMIRHIWYRRIIW